MPPGLTNVVAIAAGAAHSLALRADGTVIAWGSANYGQTNVPAGLANVVAIAAAGTYSIAITNTTSLPQHTLIPNPALVGGRLSIRVPTQRGRVYGLESSASLADPQWVLLPLVAGTGSAVDLVDPTAGSGCRFYRVRRW